MRSRLHALRIAGLVGLAALAVACSRTTAQVGPNGGDIVPLPGTSAKAEVIGNPDTGEVVVRTWDESVRGSEPLSDTAIEIGRDSRSAQLLAEPMPTDPPGQSSRFYGRVEWLRGGDMDTSWLRCCGQQRGGEFRWTHGWEAGRRHGDTWTEMRGHAEHRGMGMPPSSGPPMPAGEHGMHGMGGD